MNDAHRRIELRVPVPSARAGGWQLAATVHLPDAPPRRAPILVALPGAGYGRRYFDLPESGYSEAAHHARGGIVTVALDHLGCGESSLPPLAETEDLGTVAAAGDAAVRAILERVSHGTLAAGLAPIEPTCVVGVGQSMGGHVAVAMQADHRRFDGLAVLGGSVVCTTMPRPADEDAPVIASEGPRPDASPAEVAARAIAATDWRWVFHWEDVPEALVDADFRGGMPVRRTAPPWGSLTTPGFVQSLLLPGAVSREAAAVTVPVLIAMGERDLCRSPSEERAAFRSARDVDVVVVPRMAHMHNFASTRDRLWRRLETFVRQVEGGRDRRGRRGPSSDGPAHSGSIV
ncbi:MAG: alpha/beta hydrolase [Myxococcota bacterium]